MPGDGWDSANCYGYALGLNANVAPGSANDGDMIDWCVSAEIEKKYCAELIEACKNDGLVDESSAKPGLIAVFINKYADCLDYHFYRYDGGTWSHKLGAAGTVVTGIADPKLYNAALVGSKDALGSTIIGQQFVTCMFPQVKMTEESFGL